MRQPLIILKLGGSVLGGEEDLPRAVHEIYRWVRRGYRVIAVVSAFEGTTDSLIARAKSFDDAPSEDAYALLLATGEFTTASLLTLALNRAGTPARVLGPQALVLRSKGKGADADPASIDHAALARALDLAPVVVVPGFVAVGADGNFTLLGRGGSDLTALFIAAELADNELSFGAAGEARAHVRCRLLKDVDGLYERDPAKPGPPPARYKSASWADALKLDGAILQHKAVRIAQARRLEFEVAALQRDDPSVVGDHAVFWHHAPKPALPTIQTPTRTSVAILGGGVVGGGVIAHLRRLSARVDIVGLLVRDPARIREALGSTLSSVPVTTDWRQATRSAEIVVELIGGIDHAGTIVEACLREGRHVVTANKALIADRGDRLREIAASHGVTLRYSAAVGGGVPMIECIDALAREPGVAEFQGVVNGTTNFVLERLAAGADLPEAIREAQQLGYAEADPTRDLDGTDAFEKLSLLTYHAFGRSLHTSGFPRHAPSDAGPPHRLTKVGLLGPELTDLLCEKRPTDAVRLVAFARRTQSARGTSIEGGVAPRLVPPDHPLHDIPGPQNRLIVRDARGDTHVRSGTGAGRWPTSESVIADILDLLSENSTQPAQVHAHELRTSGGPQERTDHA